MNEPSKKTVVFRLDSELFELLKTAAKREHRSLNDYVECLLRDFMYNTPMPRSKKP